MKRNKTGGPVRSGLSSEVRQQLIEIKQEIRALKENLTGGADKNGLLYEVKQQLSQIKQEITALKENQSVCSSVKGL